MQRQRIQHTEPHSRKRHRRCGGWLPQMVIVMSALSVLTSLGAVTLHRMFRMESQLIRTVGRGSSFDQMQRLFRDDVHASEGVTVQGNAKASVMKLEQGDTEVLWTINGDVLRRTQRPAGDETHQDKLPGERFEFPDTRMSFDLPEQTDEGKPSVSLVLEPAEDQTPQSNAGARFQRREILAVMTLASEHATPVREARP